MSKNSWQLVRSEFTPKSAAQLVTEPVNALLGFSDDAANALAQIGIKIIFDLAASRLFGTTFDLARAGDMPSECH